MIEEFPKYESQFIEFQKMDAGGKFNYLFIKSIGNYVEVRKVRRDTWISTVAIILGIIALLFK